MCSSDLKSIWPKGGEIGMLCQTVPEAYGGLGLDFGYNAIVDEESAYYGRATTGFSLQSDIVTSYIVKYGSEEQKKHWLPRMVSGETITAIAMTEPRSEEHTSELQSLMRISYAVFCLKNKKTTHNIKRQTDDNNK